MKIVVFFFYNPSMSLMYLGTIPQTIVRENPPFSKTKIPLNVLVQCILVTKCICELRKK